MAIFTSLRRNFVLKTAAMLFLQISSVQIYALPVEQEGGKDIKILAITDLDQKSVNKDQPGTYFAELNEGILHFDPAAQKASVIWEPAPNPRKIVSGFSYKGRGMELSTLNYFNGKLYSCDDKTGIVYELRKIWGKSGGEEYVPLPFVILGGAQVAKADGFKCEWATVKDGNLWVGGHGNQKDKLVRVITPEGQVTKLDWSGNYVKMAKALGVDMPPGYVTNEAGTWSDILQRWIFLPRKISETSFNEEADESKGANKLVIADEDFNDIEVRDIGNFNPTHGFSSVKFLPGTDDQLIVALKSIEHDGETASYILVSDLNNHLLLDETKFSDDKYEGVELARKRRNVALA